MTHDFTAIMPKIMANALLVLRKRCTLSRNVNSDYSKDAAQKGSTIDIEVPVEVATRAVAPAATPPTAVDYTPTKIQLILDQWRQTDPLRLTDKEFKEIDTRKQFLPMAFESGIAALADEINSHVMSNYTGIYGYAGVAATTPFLTDTSEALEARRILTDQLCPKTGRKMLVGGLAEEAALNLPGFQDVDKAGTNITKLEGEIGRKLGMDWMFDEAVPTHTAGTASGTLVNNASVTIGDTSVPVDGGTGTLVVGDIFTVAGDSQTYVVTAAVANVASGTLSFAPAAKVAWANNAAITKKASHVVNLAYHPMAFGFASRRLQSSFVNGNRELVVVDPVCQVAFRLELSRQHKQDVWEFDVLYGSKLVDARLACRVAG
jgi:hypothetical protein